MTRRYAICGNCKELIGSDVAPVMCDLCQEDICQFCGVNFPDGVWSNMAHHTCMERKQNAYSSTKHTPPPWVVMTIDDEIWVNGVAKGETRAIADMVLTEHADDRLANAHLIAVAPAMLRELQAVVMVYGEKLSPDRLYEINAIIARAEPEDAK